MSKSTNDSSRRHVLGGTAWGVGAEALAIPTGIATVAFLTRTLGPADYGVFALAAVIVFSLQGVLNSLLSRATIRFVSLADEWRPVATTVLRMHVGLGLLVGATLWLLAPSIGGWLDSATLGPYLRIFAIDMPIAAVAHAHVHTLVGLGYYRDRAGIRSVRYITRLCLIVLLVSLGLGVAGAVLGSVGATVAEILVARRRVRASPVGPAAPLRPLLAFALPLFIAGTAVAFVKRIDLIALKAFGGTEEQAGFYAAAQNIALLPGLVSTAFGPLLLASFTRAVEHSQHEQAGRIGDDFLRLGLGLLPFAALAAGAAAEIMALLYGAPFAAGGPALALLMFAGIALLLAAISTGVLTALDRPRWAAAVAVPQLALTAGLLPVLVPRYAMTGAAIATLAAALFGALFGYLAVRRFFPLPLPLGTVARSVVIAAGAWFAATAWSTPGFLVLVKIALVCGGIVIAFLAMGEVTAAEADALRGLIRRRREPGP